MKGKAHVFTRAHINTDEIIPARHLVIDDEAELAKFAMEDIDADFVNKMTPGDIIVAGEDFGCGSSREHAVWALRGAGVSCVIAETFARIYYRNSVNNGYPAIECSGAIGKIDDGDELDINIAAGSIKNLTKGTDIPFVPFPEFVVAIANAGGLLESIKE